MVSKKITDKTYFDKDKNKSPNALPVTYIITLITTNSYITSLIYHIFKSSAIYQPVSYTHLTLPTNREV